MSAADFHFLKLEGLEPVAKGRMRLVFRHPHDPKLLVKVIRPEVIDQRWGSGQPWYKKRRRYRQYISYIRECEEYIAGCARYGSAIPFAQKITGFVETDFGLGLVMEAALDSGGNLAPTLASIALGSRLDSTIRREVEDFAASLIESELIVADLNPANIVRAFTPERGHHMVIIDGLGVSTILPFKLLSRSINRMSKRARVRALWKRLERFEQYAATK
jgi:PhoP regulatory network protein YrbL